MKKTIMNEGLTILKINAFKTALILTIRVQKR